MDEVRIETPVASTTAYEIAGKKLVFAPILRAGLGMCEGMLDLVPSARVAHIGLYRDHETLEAVEYYFKAPEDIAGRLVIVVDPLRAARPDVPIWTAAVDATLNENGYIVPGLGDA